ncbi:MAG TPA: GntR family transcriptional regulator [Bacilli bacterium]
MSVEFNDREPIYIQIVDDFKRKLANGSYQPGQVIPSRRELAKRLGVNPNTVQRAYKEMEDAGWIRTIRGLGSVLADDPAVLASFKEELFVDMTRKFVESMLAHGKTGEEILKLVKQQLGMQ